MATTEQIAELRKKIAEPDSTIFNDTNLSDVIDQADGSLLVAASLLWEEKAGMLAGLVDTSESGSSRAQSQLYKNALAMSKSYADRASKDDSTDGGTDSTYVRPRTRKATRL